MNFYSRKLRLRARSFLHPIRTIKALFFIHYILPTDRWKEIVDTDRKKAFDMKWNRYYRKKFLWNNPRTLNEKLTWLAAMTDTSKWTKYSDKYEVRKYIESLGLKDILTECYGVWDHAEDIDFESLPDKFVVKCTHDCESTIIVRDKSKMNKEEVVLTSIWPYVTDMNRVSLITFLLNPESWQKALLRWTTVQSFRQ